MRYRRLGKTGLQVSEISLGTAEIGLNYGFKDTHHYAKPAVDDSIRTIHAALDLGINLLDTARAYGDSESIIGRALRQCTWKPYLMSKVSLSQGTKVRRLPELRHEVFGSIETSLRMLGVDTLDCLLIHNMNLNDLYRPEVKYVLEEARVQGKIRFFGASCYGEEIPLSLLADPSFQVLQVAFNLLDQKIKRKVFPQACEQGVGIFVRSAYLRGVLSRPDHEVPARLAPLRTLARQAREAAGAVAESSAEVALRFCLSAPAVSSVIVGVKNEEELQINLTYAERGPLQSELLTQLDSFSLEDDPLVDTRTWEDLV